MASSLGKMPTTSVRRLISRFRVDGGQHMMGSYTHEDAEAITAAVLGLPDSLGGKRMAIRLTKLARAGLGTRWVDRRRHAAGGRDDQRDAEACADAHGQARRLMLGQTPMASEGGSFAHDFPVRLSGA